jgi:hypothetical protein
VRKKSFLGAIVGVVALAIAAVAVASPQLVQVADVDLTNKKTGKSTGIKAVLSHTDPGAEPEGNIPASRQIKLKLPNGTRTNNNAAPQCNLSTTEVANNECPANTIIGRGTAKVNVWLGPPTAVIQNVNAEVTAYNRRNAIAFRVVSEATGSLPSVTVPIIASLTKRGLLTVNIPELHPAGPSSKVILTYFQVNIAKKSKTIGRGDRRRKINLLTSPRTCKGTWKTVSDFTYDDGDTRHVESTQPCRRP